MKLGWLQVGCYLAGSNELADVIRNLWKLCFRVVSSMLLLPGTPSPFFRWPGAIHTASPVPCKVGIAFLPPQLKVPQTREAPPITSFGRILPRFHGKIVFMANSEQQTPNRRPSHHFLRRGVSLCFLAVLFANLRILRSHSLRKDGR